MTRKQKLQTEFANDPLTLGYALMTDQQRYDSLIDAIYINDNRAVTRHFLKMSLQSKTADPTQTALVALMNGVDADIIKAREFLLEFDHFDFSKPREKARLTDFLDIIVADVSLPFSNCGPDWRTSMLAEGETLVNRAYQIEVYHLKLGHVIEARI